MDGDAQQGQQQADSHRAVQALPEDAPRPGEVLGPAAVRDLDAESRTVGIAEAAEDPGGRAHQPDGGGLLGTEAPDHRRIDVAHQAHRQLGQDGGKREQQGERELLTPGHRGPAAELAEKDIFASGHICGRKDRKILGIITGAPATAGGLRRKSA